MPNWLIQFLVEQLSKYLTPTVMAELEAQAKQFVCCELAKLAKDTENTIDDVVVQKVAAALQVDLSKCAA